MLHEWLKLAPKDHVSVGVKVLGQGVETLHPIRWIPVVLVRLHLTAILLKLFQWHLLGTTLWQTPPSLLSTSVASEVETGLLPHGNLL